MKDRLVEGGRKVDHQGSMWIDCTYLEWEVLYVHIHTADSAVFTPSVSDEILYRNLLF